MSLLDRTMERKRVNATLGWGATVLVAIAALQGLRTGALLWGAFSFLIAAVAVLPSAATGEWTAMAPWPPLLLAGIAVLVRSFGGHPETAGYIALAALALVVVIELDAFTPVRMGRRFAVLFAVLTTMALQGLWTVAQFYSDRWLETGFLRSQTELQWDLVIVTAVGLVIGGVFEWYLERFGPDLSAGRTIDSTESS